MKYGKPRDKKPSFWDRLDGTTKKIGVGTAFLVAVVGIPLSLRDQWDRLTKPKPTPTDTLRREKAAQRETYVDDVSLDVWLADDHPRLEDQLDQGASDTITYAAEADGDAVRIRPQMEALRQSEAAALVGKTAFVNDDGTFAESPFALIHPVLSFKLANNSDRTVFASRLVLELTSRPDPAPLPVLACDPTRLFAVALVNEGWGEMRHAKIAFSVIPEGQRGAAPFRYVRDLGTVPRGVVIGLEREFAGEGVNVKRLLALDAAQRGSMEPYPIQAVTAAQGPFAVNRSTEPGQDHASTEEATLVGELTYADGDGQKTLKLSCPVPIAPASGLGDATPPAGRYDLALRPEGEKYTLTVPVSRTLKPGETDHFEVRVGAPRSSLHDVTARLLLTDGRVLPPKMLTLRLLVPRSMAKTSD